MTNSTISIDEAGFLIVKGQKVEDAELAKSYLSKLKRTDQGIFLSEKDGEQVFVEAFEEPLVASEIKADGTAVFQYGMEGKIALDTMKLDDWDRMHGRTSTDMPVVLSREAQQQLFDSADDYDDESITIKGKKILTPRLHEEEKAKGKATVGEFDFWDAQYQDFAKQKVTPYWDLSGPHPAFHAIFAQLKIPTSRILILGSGNGHDANFFAAQGHLVTGVDFSREAIEGSKKAYGQRSNLSFVHADLFKMPEDFVGAFDVIVEHTCFCSIPPSRRNDLVKVWKKALVPGGLVVGVFFVFDRDAGPPFGSTEWELRQRFKKDFQFLYWTRLKNSPKGRQGSELSVVMKSRALATSF